MGVLTKVEKAGKLPIPIHKSHISNNFYSLKFQNGLINFTKERMATSSPSKVYRTDNQCYTLSLSSEDALELAISVLEFI